MNMWPSDGEQIGLRLYEVQKMNLCFIFELFFPLGFMSLIAPLRLSLSWPRIFWDTLGNIMT